MNELDAPVQSRADLETELTVATAAHVEARSQRHIVANAIGQTAATMRPEDQATIERLAELHDELQQRTDEMDAAHNHCESVRSLLRQMDASEAD